MSADHQDARGINTPDSIERDADGNYIVNLAFGGVRSRNGLFYPVDVIKEALEDLLKRRSDGVGYGEVDFGRRLLSQPYRKGLEYVCDIHHDYVAFRYWNCRVVDKEDGTCVVRGTVAPFGIHAQRVSEVLSDGHPIFAMRSIQWQDDGKVATRIKIVTFDLTNESYFVAGSIPPGSELSENVMKIFGDTP